MPSLRRDDPLFRRPGDDPDRPPLTRTGVIDAAVRMARRAGFESVSMRSLARLLGVSPMALYRHVESREALLAGMADEVMAQSIVPAPGMARALSRGWRAAVTAVAGRTREACVCHPWVGLLQQGPYVGPNAPRPAPTARRPAPPLGLSDLTGNPVSLGAAAVVRVAAQGAGVEVGDAAGGAGARQSISITWLGSGCSSLGAVE